MLALLVGETVGDELGEPDGGFVLPFIGVGEPVGDELGELVGGFLLPLLVGELVGDALG